MSADTATDCIACAAGQDSSTPGIASAETCIECEAGRYQPGNAFPDACVECSAGQYASNASSVQCTLCEMGGVLQVAIYAGAAVLHFTPCEPKELVPLQLTQDLCKEPAGYGELQLSEQGLP